MKSTNLLSSVSELALRVFPHESASSVKAAMRQKLNNCDKSPTESALAAANN